jgi:acyl-CoA synthetase (AMP-forming)/AMP-acid ligase II
MTPTKRLEQPAQIDVSSLHHRRASHRWERTCVGDLLERLTWSYPEKEAIVAREGAYAYPENARVTYRAADRLANRVANAMLARGLQHGDRVLLFCENSVEAYLVKIAIAKAGLVCVPINPMLAADVVSHLIERVDPQLAFVDDELWPKAQAPFVDAGLAPTVTIPICGEIVPGSLSFADFIADEDGLDWDHEPDVEIHGDDIWEIIFTSGTTAMPKGAMVSHTYSHLAAYSFALTLSRGIKIECDLKLCAFLPLIYHIADEIFSFPAFVCGGTLVIGRHHDPAKIAEAICEERITALWGGSPAMLEDLAGELQGGAQPLDASSLKVIVFGWTAIAPELVEELKRLTSEDLIVVEILGQTEAISCHRFWPEKWPETFAAHSPALNYVGVPNPLLAATVVDENGDSLEGTTGVPGEVVYRSPVVTAGYYLDEEATREAFRGGWFHSGDVCMYDEDGLRIMVDRSKDMIKSGGENVSTLRVETILRQHPAVLKAAVVGLPHERWDEAVTAIVVPAPGHSPDAAEIISFCRERLAGYESPKGVLIVDELPETVGGKVLKYKLRVAHADFYRR